MGLPDFAITVLHDRVCVAAISDAYNAAGIFDADFAGAAMGGRRLNCFGVAKAEELDFGRNKLRFCAQFGTGSAGIWEKP